MLEVNERHAIGGVLTNPSATACYVEHSLSQTTLALMTQKELVRKSMITVRLGVQMALAGQVPNIACLSIMNRR